ncbi:hypothetical protein C7974DRAFT_139167, partial [Boeremia exigua]|uniref:uncharacterized protein n=1 Tax=Boeremia exigua TaxID=749465 RepID=UPI001E8EC7ED
QEPGASALNFIYSCSICGVTFADRYEGHNETVQGLSDGINPKDRLVTKLFLSDCCHVFCGEHLEGGGPPFHPAGQTPRAPCPYCVKKKGDSTPRDLYSVRGFGKDEYDPKISPIWFMTPPMSLRNETNEMEVLRFQYLALARYCRMSYLTTKPLADALKQTRQELVTMQQRAADDHSKVVSLQHANESLRAAAHQANEVEALRAEVHRLRHLELAKHQLDADVETVRLLKADVRDLDILRKNKAAILQYMKLLPKVIEQNTRMKERLSSLGFAIPVEPVPNYTQLKSDDFDEIGSIADAYAEDDRQFQKSSSTHTAGRSAHTSGHPFSSSDRPSKRQRVDSPLPNMQVHARSSRERMPPPALKPRSSMNSVRRFLPSIRKKFSSSRSLSKEPRSHDADLQMYDNGEWRDAAESRTGDGRSSPRFDLRSETPYMSGALPAENNTQRSQLLANVGADPEATRFSFRAPSPVKKSDGRGGNQPVQLPSVPSYLRLMDGLVNDNDMELGLSDPREAASSSYTANTNTRPAISTPHNQRQNPEPSSQPRWRLGHAFLHQSSDGPSNDQQHSSPLAKTRGFFNRANYDSNTRTATPSLHQPQQPAPQAQNVFTSFRRLSVTETPILTDRDRMA